MHWRSGRIVFNPRLGPVPLELQRMLPPNINPKALSSYRRYPDAIVGFADHVLMVEAKIIASGGAVGMMEEYLLLWKQTTEYGGLHKLPVTAAILTALTDPLAKQIALDHGMQWLVYSPGWILTDLMSSTFNITPPVVPGQASTLEARGQQGSSST